MRFYLAGPMTGYRRFNFDAFASYARRLRDEGHSVFSPAERDLALGFDPSQGTLSGLCIENVWLDNIRELLKSDAIALMPGHTQSRGARLERELARCVGLLERELDPPASRIADEAVRIVHGARRSAYGHPRDNHAATAAFWSTWLRRRYGVELTLDARDVCWMNALQKASREAHRHTDDNAVDVIGFLLNAEACEDGPQGEDGAGQGAGDQGLRSAPGRDVGPRAQAPGRPARDRVEAWLKRRGSSAHAGPRDAASRRLEAVGEDGPPAGGRDRPDGDRQPRAVPRAVPRREVGQ